jgi:hypothetical protein
VAQVICDTPALSDAVPPRLIVLLDAVKLEDEVGDVMLIAGGVVSVVGVEVTVTTSEALATFPAASPAVTVI